MGKIPLEEILTALLISHWSTLIAGQLGKPKEPVWEQRQTGQVQSQTGARMGEEAKRSKATSAGSLSARGAPTAAGKGAGRTHGSEALLISPSEPDAAINRGRDIYSSNAALVFCLCVLSC